LTKELIFLERHQDVSWRVVVRLIFDWRVAPGIGSISWLETLLRTAIWKYGQGRLGINWITSECAVKGS
jgi:hypothetical protein